MVKLNFRERGEGNKGRDDNINGAPRNAAGGSYIDFSAIHFDVRGTSTIL